VRAAIYSRFSTDRQNESSIADQVRVCTEHADGRGWQVVERFEDQGISGAALGNRPGVLKLQEAAFAGRFDAVLATDLSRLSRSQGDLSKMIDRLVAKGIRVVGVQDGYDSSRRGHKLQAGLSGIIGEAFREMVKDRTYAALESRAKEKKLTGGRAYGYRSGKVDRARRTSYERYSAALLTARVAERLPPSSMAVAFPHRVRLGNAINVAPLVGWDRESARYCAMSVTAVLCIGMRPSGEKTRTRAGESERRAQGRSGLVMSMSRCG
jgi:DNA invertase Pin-like site-specific DNA recombinase